MCRPFWVGFSAAGLGALGLCIFICLRFGGAVNRYLDFLTSPLEYLLRSLGLADRPGEHGFRYSVVILTIVLLLALPQIALAVFGGWMVERTQWRSLGARRERIG